jgi:hypothetical protein
MTLGKACEKKRQRQDIERTGRTGMCRAAMGEIVRVNCKVERKGGLLCTKAQGGEAKAITASSWLGVDRGCGGLGLLVVYWCTHPAGGSNKARCNRFFFLWALGKLGGLSRNSVD